MTSSAQPRFAVAARRHVEDGSHLHDHSRIATADHLAGLGAECALKAILLDLLGATPGRHGIPQTSGKLHDVHVNKLWQQVITVAAGRNHASFLGLLTSSAPFADWRVEERYADGSQCSTAQTATRLAVGQSLLARHQQARILGRLS